MDGKSFSGQIKIKYKCLITVYFLPLFVAVAVAVVKNSDQNVIKVNSTRNRILNNNGNLIMKKALNYVLFYIFYFL